MDEQNQIQIPEQKEKKQKIWPYLFIAFLIIAILVMVVLIYAQKLTISQKVEDTTKVATTSAIKIDPNDKISSQIPRDLVKKEDVKQVIQSYDVTEVQGGNQYTFRYVSRKDLISNSVYYKTYLSKNGWHLNSPITENKNFVSITATKDQKEKMIITINDSNPIGVSVDVTYIK